MKEFTQEQKNAAYALNLCTVSVSQIIDFNDINIMEQEYEAILNNLNLEKFPKDEALLEIIKQILDTITFFKIQNSKKDMIEKEYQHRMKNAIWSAVPNFGLIVAGGNPVTIAVSLASQVGIGYMNYRRTKSTNELAKERQMLELEWTAIEQLNGLRRELFDTAWRLAGKYNYPDELRLTERQIRQYNEMLMDANLLRRYDRLDAVKDNFSAYPPFWYQFGSTANEISRDETLEISAETREMYHNAAQKCFDEYWNVNSSPLLREDQIAAACALEYADILIEDKSDKNKILSYLEKAIQSSGNACDVLQMTAITYLRIGETEKALPLLRYLVNEEYNASINAQILSGIYINQYIGGRESARSDYETLEGRVVNTGYLVPWPDNNKDLEDNFIQAQRNLLERKYQKVLDALKDKYVIKFNRIMPVPNRSKEYQDSFFTEMQIGNRIDQMRSVLAITERKDEYVYEVQKAEFAFKYIDMFNDLLRTFENLDSVTNINKITDIASEKIRDNSDELNELQTRMQKGEFSIDDYIRIQEFTSEKFLEDLFDEAASQVKAAILQMTNMEEFSSEESRLVTFCNNNGLPDPDLLLNGSKKTDELVGGARLFIKYGILGANAEDRSKQLSKYNKMMEIAHSKLRECVLPNSSVKCILADDVQFANYFNKKNDFIKQYKADVIAILDDTNIFTNIDLLFTTTGIVYVAKDKLQEVRTYESVKFESLEEGVQIGSKDYKNKGVNIEELYEAIKELNRIVVER